MAFLTPIAVFRLGLAGVGKQHRELQPQARSLRQTAKVTARVIVMPTGTAIFAADIAKLCAVVRGIAS